MQTGTKIGVVIMTLVALAVLDSYLKLALYEWSIPWIVYLQSTLTGQQIEFWEWYTDFCFTLVWAAIIAPYLSVEQRHRCFYYLVLLIVIINLQNIFKTAYADPRPFWTSTQVIAMKCTASFGNPSGHSIEVMAYSFAVWLDFVRSSKNKPAINSLSLVMAIAYPLSIGYSRFILGAHTLDHILYGFALGLLIATSAEFIAKPCIFRHLLEMPRRIKECFWRYAITALCFVTVVVIV